VAQNSVTLTDLVNPTVFTGMVLERTKEKTEVLRSGILQSDGVLEDWLASTIGNGGGGFLLTRPTWNDLASGDSIATGMERSASEAESPLYTAGFGTAFPPPQDINTHTEVCVYVDRNNHWSSMNVSAMIAGAKGKDDPLTVIASLVADYWRRRLQKMVLATVAGVIADNAAAPTGSDTHTLNDLRVDISGGGFVDGLTNISASAVLDACQTLGDAKNQITNIAVHSVVHNRMHKNNLLDTVKESEGETISYFRGLRVTVDDGMPNPSTGVYDSYLFGPGFLRFGDATWDKQTELVRRPEAGNGSGSDELWNRVRWCVHPMGHAFIGTPVVGGPTNAATSNNLAHADSWSRRAQSRKHIPFAYLRTREF